MKLNPKVMHLCVSLLAAGLMLAACAQAATTLPPTAVPVTATVAPPTAAPTPAIAAVGTDINLTLLPGDAARGEQLAAVQGCIGCHVADGGGGPGPLWAAAPVNDDQGVATRAETRYLADDYTGHATSAQQYLIESILVPSVYIIDKVGYTFSPGKSAMPASFGEKLTAQDLADIVTYLETIK